MNDTRRSTEAPSTVGPYTILGELGRGGMGTVYRARDTRLRRDVALKVLPEELRRSPIRLARFEQEARLVAALNNPNIAAIYGIEDGDAGVQALVLELVEGKTLATRIAEGRLGIDEALTIARQIAQALDAAHAKGIVHRDLKPANIVITPTGLVKVLDFGVAKMTDPSEAAPEETVTAGFTREGVIVGTPTYMSPEQSRGQVVDKRTDLWAFGCVVYEMLTGHRPFEGETSSQTIAAVQTANPDWHQLPPHVPAVVTALLKRCLEREPAKRLADVAAVRFALEDLHSIDRAPAATRTAGNRMAWALAGLLAIVAVFAVTTDRFRATPAADDFSFSIVPPEGTIFETATTAGAPALSADGKQLAFVARGPRGRQLWTQPIGSLEASPIASTDGAACPSWAVDRSWLGFLSGDFFKKVNINSGGQQVLGRTLFGRVCFSAAQNQSGTILFQTVGNTLASIPAGGGQPAQAAELNFSFFEENLMAPAFLPDNQHYLMQIRAGPELEFQLWVGRLGSNDRDFLLRDVTNARYAPPISGGPGHLVYVRGTTLVAHPFDPATRTLIGSPVTIDDNVVVGGGGALGDFDLSPNGVLAFRRGGGATKELRWLDKSGTEVGTLGTVAGNPRSNLRTSLNGKLVAFTRAGSAAQDVWTAELAAGAKPQRFTLEGGRSPVWSHDGSRIAYLRGNTVHVKTFEGADDVPVWTGPGTLSINDWSGDDKYLLLTRWDTSKPRATGRGLWLLPNPLDPTASHEPVPFEVPALHGQFGPRNGPARWIAFDASDGDRGQVWVRPMPDARGKWQVSEGGGSIPRWRGDGSELYFLSNSMMTVADIDAGASFHRRSLRALFPLRSQFLVASGQYAPGWDVTPDGQYFVVTMSESDEPARAISIVQNWQSMLKRRP